MAGPDLVVSVAADEQQAGQSGVDRERFEQAQGGRVRPLQVVEEEGQRLVGLGQRVDETGKQMQAALLVEAVLAGWGLPLSGTMRPSSGSRRTRVPR